MQIQGNISRYLVYVGLGVMYFLVGCSKPTDQTTAGHSPTDSVDAQSATPEASIGKPAQPRKNPLDEQAQALALEEMRKVWVRQGESWFCIFVNSPYDKRLIEAKDLAWKEITTQTLSQVDKLNGLEWSGVFRTTASANRQRQLNSSNWSLWKEGLTTNGAWYQCFLYSVEKRNGKWNVVNGLSGYEKVGTTYLYRPSAEQIAEP